MFSNASTACFSHVVSAPEMGNGRKVKVSHCHLGSFADTLQFRTGFGFKSSLVHLVLKRPVCIVNLFLVKTEQTSVRRNACLVFNVVLHCNY